MSYDSLQITERRDIQMHRVTEEERKNGRRKKQFEFNRHLKFFFEFLPCAYEQLFFRIFVAFLRLCRRRHRRAISRRRHRDRIKEREGGAVG